MASGKIKNFFKKNSFLVVFIIALVIAISNYLIYPVFISKDLKLIDVPVAKETIKEGSLITDEDITFVQISEELLPSGIVISKDYLIGKYIMQNNAVPKNGFFYLEVLTDKEEILGGIFKELNDGEFSYTQEISSLYDQNENLKVGQLVDIFFDCEYQKIDRDNPNNTEENAVVYGLLKENARIVGLVDNGDTRYVTYALKEDDLGYFTIAEHMAKNYKGKIIPLVSSESGNQMIKSNLYDVDSLRAWLKDKGNLMTIPEELRGINSIDEISTGLIEESEINGGGSIN